MRYDFDPTAISVSFKVFPKGDYEFSIGEPRAFARVSQEGKETYGIRFPLKCEGVIDGDSSLVGERAVYTAYLHGGDNPFVKQFIMGALGFSLNSEGEKEFNEKYKGYDWSYDPQAGTVGDMWSEVTGSRVIASLDAQLFNDELRQQWKSFRAVKDAI